MEGATVATVTNRGASVARLGSRGWAFVSAKTAASKSVQDVKDQTSKHPAEEAEPGHFRQLTHEIDAGGDGSERDPRNQRRAKRPGTVRFFDPQNNYTGRNNREGEESSNIGQFDQFVNVRDGGAYRDDHTSNDGRDMRRTKSGMDLRRPGRKQTITGHGEKDTRLARLVGDQRGGCSHDSPERDETGRPMHSQGREDVGQRFGVI